MKTLIPTLVLSLLTSFAHAEEKEEVYDVQKFESRVAEIGTKITISITNKHLKDSPKWDGKDMEKLPVSAKQAVAKAMECLKVLGCKPKNYYLMECAIVREHRSRTCDDWYWKVVFGDNSNTMINVQALITIPVLLNGKLPIVEMEPLDRDVEEDD